MNCVSSRIETDCEISDIGYKTTKNNCGPVRDPISKNGSQEELSFGDFTKDELATLLNRQLNKKSRSIKRHASETDGSRLKANGDTRRRNYSLRFQTVPWNIIDHTNHRPKKSCKTSSELEYGSVYETNSSYNSTFSSTNSTSSSSDSLKAHEKPSSVCRTAAVTSTMNSQHSLSTPDNNRKDLEAKSETTTAQPTTATSDTPRRNKRRKPPSYYQSAEYAAILKNSGTTNANEVNGLTSQIGSMGLDEQRNEDKGNDHSAITTNGEASAKVEAPRVAWGKPVGPVVVAPDSSSRDSQSPNNDQSQDLTHNNTTALVNGKPSSSSHGISQDVSNKVNGLPAAKPDTINSNDDGNTEQKPTAQAGTSDGRDLPVNLVAQAGTSAQNRKHQSAPVSWATLFKANSNGTEDTSKSTHNNKNIQETKKQNSVNSSTNQVNGHSGNAININHTTSSRGPTTGTETDPSKVEVLRMLGNMFKMCELKHSAPALQPRGIRNKQNWCYINATLQALLACPPFYNLIKSIFQKIKSSNQNCKSVPCIAALGRYISEFKTMVRLPSDSKSNLVIGDPFDIDYFYDTLASLKAELTFTSGRQEDAQEFLSFLLNRLHEEMVTCLDSLNPNFKHTQTNGQSIQQPMSEEPSNSDEKDDSDDWNIVGRKNRAHVTRKVEFKQSPLSDIFCGQFRSALSQPGVKEKDSLSLEPFFTLPLDIQSDGVRTVQQALEHFVQKEEVFGFTNQETKKETEAFKRMSFEDLPPVLILYLKCFVYDKYGGIQKLLKRIDFQIDLEINKELIAPNQRSKLKDKKRSYKLFSVEYHHGDKATGGHYITDVYHPGIIGWVRYDDAKVRVVSNAQVLKSEDKKLVPYLLYYRRADYI